MDQLSSCYFCGDANPASLDEHPVVPTSLGPTPESQTTVVLCPDCREKLDAVVEVVLGAVDESPSTGTDSIDEPDAADESGSVSDIESTLGDDDDVLRSVGDDGDGDADSPASSADERGSSEMADEMEWGGRESTASDAETDTTDEDQPGASGEDDERTYSSGRRAGYTGTDRTDQRGDGSNGDGRDGDGQDADDSETGGASETGHDAGGDGDEDTPDVTLTRLENTKVMRLLQNREFPVDRDDFVTVASSAYEVSRDDCGKVVDLAVEHDLLREEGGQLHAGPRWD